MLRREIDKIGIDEFNRQFLVVFENTGREHNATLDFVHDVETKWEIPVVWLEYIRANARDIDEALVPEGRKRSNLLKQKEQGVTTHWFKVVNHETAARIGQHGPFDEFLTWAAALPNVRSRSCSGYLKVRTHNRYLESLGIKEFDAYIGIRADESHRALEITASMESYRTAKFPLIEDGIIKNDVDDFWNSNEFKLNIENHFGNCDLCFLKAKWKRASIAKSNPENARWWADQEKKFAIKSPGTGQYFRMGESYQSLIDGLDQMEMDLFSEDDDIPCSCAVGAYRQMSDDEI